MKRILIFITIFLVSAVFSYYITINLIVKNTKDIVVERVVEVQENNIENNE